MRINTNLLRECEICFRNFSKLDIHHINGNHEDNREENRTKICKDCHTSIHKPVSERKIRGYKLESDENIIRTLYHLREKLHKTKYGTLKFIPKDYLTQKASFLQNRKKFHQQLKKVYENIQEIRY